MEQNQLASGFHRQGVTWMPRLPLNRVVVSPAIGAQAVSCDRRDGSRCGCQSLSLGLWSSKPSTVASTLLFKTI